jgi:hypothetical protein
MKQDWEQVSAVPGGVLPVGRDGARQVADQRLNHGFHNLLFYKSFLSLGQK